MVGLDTFNELVGLRRTIGTTTITLTIPSSQGTKSSWYTKPNSRIIVNNRLVSIPKIDSISKRHSGEYPFLILNIQMERVECLSY